VLSKCANPECSEIFRYLHQGKLFGPSPTPEKELAAETIPAMHERFWLCEKCSKEMTLVWSGTEAKLMPIPAQGRTEEVSTAHHNPLRRKRRPRARAASAGRVDR